MSPDKGNLQLLHWVLIAGCVLFAGGGNLLLKWGMSQMGSVAATELPKLQYALQAACRPQIIVGVVLYVASFVMWLSLLSMVDISLVYPIFIAAAFLLVTGGAVVWFGERVDAMRAIGTIVVVAGIGLVSLSGRG